MESKSDQRFLSSTAIGVGVMAVATTVSSAFTMFSDAARYSKYWNFLSLGSVAGLVLAGMLLYLFSARTRTAQVEDAEAPQSSDGVEADNDDDVEVSAAEKIFELTPQEVVGRITTIWESRFKKISDGETHKRRVRTFELRMVNRLSGELEALGVRANLNLAIGSVISLVGLCVLAYFVTTHPFDADSNMTEFGITFFVRLSLVAFIEIFAYFFLRLYRHSLFEIKYFQNEITNVQLKFIALEIAQSVADEKLYLKICEELISSERNFILKKGETTVALQKDALAQSADKSLISSFEKILASANLVKS